MLYDTNLEFVLFTKIITVLELQGRLFPVNAAILQDQEIWQFLQHLFVSMERYLSIQSAGISFSAFDPKMKTCQT